MPGWRLSFLWTDRNQFDAAADERIAAYFWTGVLVIGGMSLQALLIGRAFRRQVRLTRLKNDLVATCCVTTLRGKIEPDPRHPTHIRTIRDIGYRFEIG